MTATMGRATARATLDNPAALNAPLFRQLVEQRDETKRQVILDLGTTSTSMLSLLGRSPCKVEIADFGLDREIALMNTEAADEDLVARAESLLPKHRSDDPVDIVFCWDLPNYLKPDAMSALMAAIAARSRPGAIAHALVVYSERTMPDRPRRYIPTGDCHLVNHANATGTIEAPRHSPEALSKIMGRFEIDRARLLANGMQEFLFRLAA